jgi:glycosyltransferase involved in cell wall biosynthesis
MKIAIIGTRGIPNNHGGFEQFAEFLAPGLVEEGFDVTVYNSHNHPYQEKDWKGVQIVHCFDPEYKIGTAGQFIYDFNCIMDARKKDFDIILQLGYTSSSVWGRLLPRKKSIITTNMDGLEWKRTKYSRKVQKFLEYAEALAVKHSDHLISDSVGIQGYLQEKYGKPSSFIPYGANLFTTPDAEVLSEYGLEPYGYNLLIARMEPENSIETILDGVAASNDKRPFLVIGRHESKFGYYLKEKFSAFDNIRFLGGIYDFGKLNNLRYFSSLYFHGHTVGGTNPSLLEAMASNSLICAHDNIFNRSILESDAFYFAKEEDIRDLLNYGDAAKKLSVQNQTMLRNNTAKIRNNYAWSIIIESYIAHFRQIFQAKHKQPFIQVLTPQYEEVI